MFVRGNTGFGLIELLIVIAIIGILGGLVLAGTRRSQESARDAAIESALRQMRFQAEVVYDNQGGSYLNWASLSNPVVGEEIQILLEEIDTQFGDTDPGYVTFIRQDVEQEFCVSAPSKQDSGQYACIDARGELKRTTAHCPSTGLPRCP